MMTMPPPEPVQTTMAKIFDRKGFFRMDQVRSAGHRLPYMWVTVANSGIALE